MKEPYWHANRPRLPHPTRPAQVLSRRVVGYKDDVPQYEAQIRCDDNKTRVFVSGPEGRWVRKGA